MNKSDLSLVSLTNAVNTNQTFAMTSISCIEPQLTSGLHSVSLRVTSFGPRYLELLHPKDGHHASHVSAR